MLHCIFFRGVIAESEDVIKAAADGLGKNGFINYYGLQVYSCLPSCLKIYFPFISEAHLVSFFLFHLLSVLEVVQFQRTLLVLLCSEESGRLL